MEIKDKEPGMRNYLTPKCYFYVKYISHSGVLNERTLRTEEILTLDGGIQRICFKPEMDYISNLSNKE